MIGDGFGNNLINNKKEDYKKMETYNLVRLFMPLILAMCFVITTACTSKAVELSEMIRNSIEQAFPNAQITDSEQESWNGERVTEVELISTEGIRYEVYVSAEGKIIKTEEEDGELPWIGGELTIGLAARLEREIYKNEDTEISPVPFLRYENGSFEIQAYEDLIASYTVFGTNNFEVAIKGTINFADGYDADDNDYFKGMDELDTVYTVGFELEKMYGGWTADFEFAQDISGEHDGQEVALTIGYTREIGEFEFRPSLNATWLSKDIVDYYYGVSPTEANPERPSYSPDSSYEIGAELMILRPIFGDFKIVGIIEIATFGDDIKDSPLVDEDYEIECILGVTYTF